MPASATLQTHSLLLAPLEASLIPQCHNGQFKGANYTLVGGGEGGEGTFLFNTQLLLLLLLVILIFILILLILGVWQ